MVILVLFLQLHRTPLFTYLISTALHSTTNLLGWTAPLPRHKHKVKPAEVLVRGNVVSADNIVAYLTLRKVHWFFPSS